MSRISTRELARRIVTLENCALRSSPYKRNVLLDISIRAMAWAWTPDEIEKILVAAERHELEDLPADLRCRWVQNLDRIALANFGRTFATLLAGLDKDRPPAFAAIGEQPQPASAVPSVQPPKLSRPSVF
jgi:hypothetical protein